MSLNQPSVLLQNDTLLNSNLLWPTWRDFGLYLLTRVAKCKSKAMRQTTSTAIKLLSITQINHFILADVRFQDNLQIPH